MLSQNNTPIHSFIHTLETSNRNVMQATYVTLNFLVVTFKNVKPGEDNFNAIFHLTQYMQNIISTYALATFWRFNSCIWLVDTILDNTWLEILLGNSTHQEHCETQKYGRGQGERRVFWIPEISFWWEKGIKRLSLENVISQYWGRWRSTFSTP